MSRKQSSVVHFYIEPGSISGNSALFTREESDHILKTFRLYIGDTFLATDGCGNLYQMELTAFEDRCVLAAIKGRRSQVGELAAKITVGFGIPQLAKGDQIIDQCTQLGASAFLPILSKNSKTKLTGEKAAARTSRWQNVAISAVKQSLRTVLPEILPPGDLVSVVDELGRYDGVYIGSMRGKALAEVEATKTAGSILLLTGPEEGFSRIEEDKLIRAGAIPVSLGSRRMRAELAAVVMLTLFSNRCSQE